ncbi:MAG: DUF1080 domain-containing protein [Bacteroidota bacterium]
MLLKHVISLCFAILMASSLLAQESEWQYLLNGTDFSGWKQLNGKAKYEMIDGMVVGTAVPKEPNSFMATEKTYGDFILELEVKVDSPLNCGIQIRSLSKPEYNNGRVHGYQVEVDPSTRAWSGGIYDEARRGWLYPLAGNHLGQKAFKNGQWNYYRIEAIGPSFRTWINGVPCSNLLDDMTHEGFIALQVHGVGRDESKVGLQVRYRNVRIMTENLLANSWGRDMNIPEINMVANSLSDRERREGWKMIWDGKTTDGWRGAKLDNFPKGGWKIEEGVLKVLASGGGESENGGDIVSTHKYGNFELKLDFRITEGANSGIKYYVDTELNQGAGSSIGLEYQILDDQKHPDAKQGLNGNRTVASLYDLIRAENLEFPNRKKPFNGVGKWNQARIISKDGHVEHWLNGRKVVEFERGTQMYRALVEKSKYVKWPNFGEAPRGHILLQDHGDEVHFRSIKIREL